MNLVYYCSLALVLIFLLLSQVNSFTSSTRSVFAAPTRPLPTSSYTSLRSRSGPLLKFVASVSQPPSTTEASSILDQIIDLEKSYNPSTFTASKIAGNWLLQFVINPSKDTLGDVSAAGLTFPTTGQITTQEIDVDNLRISNKITSSGIFSKVEVGGSISLPPSNPTRAIVTFDNSLLNEFINISLLFKLISFLKKLNILKNDDQWVDTTYLDSTARVARGNKGSIFLLTKINNDKVTKVEDVKVGSPEYYSGFLTQPIDEDLTERDPLGGLEQAVKLGIGSSVILGLLFGGFMISNGLI
ncbi:hypothetical protein TrLO_g13632 [Triparma laevis f. longispina]|uniref:Plastid lipid-associated protein/fibrillin conserved domain-containing protein n=1 Tax=Triparma laevis f. longispina TaxID=1714387 RepID=A0A9W6ZUU8_9STRA|nr:hypothetical protein TrLO_g13632 [Triparma laevis f. longispina]